MIGGRRTEWAELGCAHRGEEQDSSVGGEQAEEEER